MDSLLEVEHLVKHFPIRGSRAVVQAVNDVSFGIRLRETVGLIGESGSGKTTVGRCILRLIDPTAGRVAFRGEDLTALGQKQFAPLRSRLQMVFQDPYQSLDPRMRVFDIIAEPLQLQAKVKHMRLEPKVLETKVEELIGKVELSAQHAGKYPHQMTGGERQRVGIARAIATEPDLVVLDEPTTALDLTIRGRMIDLLMSLQEQLGLTYLYISHDLSTVEYICHTVTIMYLGRIVEMGPKTDVFESPVHPYAKALLSSVLYPDPSVKRDALVWQGEIPSPIHLPSGCHLHSRCPRATSECAEVVPEMREVCAGHFVACFHA
jgi:oligopeptide/dipeptide ABC transporter ATP-binding protein